MEKWLAKNTLSFLFVYYFLLINTQLIVAFYLKRSAKFTAASSQITVSQQKKKKLYASNLIFSCVYIKGASASKMLQSSYNMRLQDETKKKIYVCYYS